MRKFYQLLLPVLAAVSLAFLSCKKGNDNRNTTIFGEPASLGTNGKVRAFVILDKYKTPLTVGMRFSPGALDNLPADSTREYEYPVALPEEARPTGFDHLVIDWNPVGHEPKAIYGLPHFDFHYYRITPEEQAEVHGGPDLTPVPPQFIPKDYVSGVFSVPYMGVHWSDTLAPEFRGNKFTDTFIYGFYQGHMTFMEPMITKAFLDGKPDHRINIKQPESFEKTGYYPTVMHISFDRSQNEYVMALEGLVKFTGSEK